jgi:hypothetical protein
MQASRHRHVDERVQPEQVDLAAHQVGHAAVSHRAGGGFPLGPALTLDVLLK